MKKFINSLLGLLVTILLFSSLMACSDGPPDLPDVKMPTVSIETVEEVKYWKIDEDVTNIKATEGVVPTIKFDHNGFWMFFVVTDLKVADVEVEQGKLPDLSIDEETGFVKIADKLTNIVGTPKANQRDPEIMVVTSNDEGFWVIRFTSNLKTKNKNVFTMEKNDFLDCDVINRHGDGIPEEPEVPDHQHERVFVPGIAATAQNPIGAFEHYKCTKCELLFVNKDSDSTLDSLAMNGNAKGQNIFDPSTWQVFANKAVPTALPTLKNNALEFTQASRFDFFHSYSVGGNYQIADSWAKVPAEIRNVAFKHEIEFSIQGGAIISLFNVNSGPAVPIAGAKPTYYLEFTSEGITFTANRESGMLKSNTMPAVSLDGTKHKLTIYSIRTNENTLKIKLFLNNQALVLDSSDSNAADSFAGGDYVSLASPGAGQRMGFAPQGEGALVKLYSAYWVMGTSYGPTK